MFGLFKSILTKIGIGSEPAPAPAPVAEAPAAPVEATPVVAAEAPAAEVAAVEAAPVEETPEEVLAAIAARDAGLDENVVASFVEETPIPDMLEAAPVPEPVDVVAVMDAKVAASSEKGLDWRHSIVDLLKLLELDSSLKARQELAKELGYTGSTDAKHSGDMNVWLIKEVLKQVAESGGTVPKSLTH